MNKKAKIRRSLAQFFYLALFFATALVTGFLIGLYNSVCIDFGYIKNGSNVFYLYGLTVYVVAVYLQMMIHECGHLVFGLLSGYRFVSIRFASFVLTKINGKLKLKRYTLAGTGGQCIMAPPDSEDADIPVAIYHLGGCFANLISSLLFTALWFFSGNPFASYFLIAAALWGLTSALQNGIPMTLPAISNDGKNVIIMRKNKTARRSFILSVKIVEALTNGIRIKDLPKELFETEKDDTVSDHLSVSILISRCDRLIDEHRFAEAKEELINILELPNCQMIGVTRAMLVNNLICCEAFDTNNEEIYKKYITEEHVKLSKALAKNIGTIRTRYVRAVLISHDLAEAQKELKLFKALQPTYPFSADYESELELIELADKIAQERQTTA